MTTTGVPQSYGSRYEAVAAHRDAVQQVCPTCGYCGPGPSPATARCGTF